nr:MAG TPA: hypothetical protein [Caudoviricetes sp.]
MGSLCLISLVVACCDTQENTQLVAKLCLSIWGLRGLFIFQSSISFFEYF